jgi:hypothetical protein
VNRSVGIHFSIITPGGYIIRLDLEDAPKQTQDVFRAVEEPTSIQLEKAVAFMSRMTGCRCTVHRSEQVTCDVSSPVGATS